MSFCQSLQSLKTLYDGFVSAGNRTTITVNVYTAITAHIAGVTETSLCLSLTGRAVLNFDTDFFKSGHRDNSFRIEF